MIITWRIIHNKYVDTAFDGEGARRYGGRWNHPGLKIVYTSATLSLAALEMLAGLHSIKILDAYECICVKIPKNFIHIPDTLPKGWNTIPAGSVAKDIGTQWLRTGDSPVLEVPSIVIPSEKNYLLNPDHPRFNDLAIGRPHKFRFDPRLA